MSRHGAEADMARDSVETAGRPGRRLRRWHLLLIFFGLMVATFVLWRVAVSRALEAELQMIHDVGYPVTAAELNAWYERVPDEENAALAVLEAVRLMREPDVEIRRHIPHFNRDLDVPDDLTMMPAEMERAMSDYIEMNSEALRKLNEAAVLERSRYPVDFTRGWDISQDHITSLRRAVHLLDVKTLLHLQQNRTDLALDSARTMLRVAETLETEPGLLSQGIRRIMRREAARAVGRVLQHGRLSDREIETLAESLKEAETPSLTRQGLVGERVVADSYFDRTMPEPLEYSLGDRWGHPRWDIYRLSGAMEYDHLLYIKHLNELFEIAQLSHEERIAALNRWDANLPRVPSHAPITSLMLPVVRRRFTYELREVAHLRTIRAALAVERYRLAHGELPLNLEEVAPDFIDKLPADPFTGDPLRYETLPEGGFIVYTVGQDQTDDGGAKRNAAGKKFHPGSDIPFRVLR